MPRLWRTYPWNLHCYNEFRRVVRNFFCPRITRIDTNMGRGFVLPKLREVAHRILCFLFAFVRLFRGRYPFEPPRHPWSSSSEFLFP